MNENNEALTAPAQAVEANTGTPEGGAVKEGAATNDNPPQTTGAASAPTAETVSHQASSSDEGSDEGDDGEAEGEEGAEAQGAEGAGDPAKKKRRRRRKKKGPRPEGAAVEGAPAEGAVVEGASTQGGAAPQRPQRQGREGRDGHHGRDGQHGGNRERHVKEGQGGVFARFFDGPAGTKRHAFAAGEVVAGRVLRVNEGAFVVDLFGKATAFVDIFEPHEVPVLPEPPPPPAPEPVAPVSAWAVPGADASPAAEAPAEAPASETAEAAAPAAEAINLAPEAIVAETIVAETPVVDAPAAQAEQAVEGEHAAEAAHAAEDTHDHAHDHAHGDEEHTDEAADAEAEAEPEAPPAPELGSIFRGRIGSVAESGHVVLVNRIIDAGQAKKRIAAARDEKKRVRGLVFGFNRGGFDVLVEGARVFCPASGMALAHIENPEELLGQRLEFTVPPSKTGGHGLVVSRRGILERLQRKNAKKLFRTLTPGQRLKGRVTQVREFGVFVDLGGIEGLVHQSELSFSRGVRPEDACKIGDEVMVQVLRVGEGQTRKERERVSLSMKALQDDPWAEHAAMLEPGTVLTGKVVRTTDFGAFIEILPQVEGLLHISELGRELKHANQALNEGDEIRVVVERADRKARRISLSKLSQSEEKAIEGGASGDKARPPKPGQNLLVVVDKIEAAGLIVQIPGVFGRRGRGFIPNVEMGTERGTDHRRQFPQGTEIQVKAIGVDRDGGFRFSRKALLVDEEKRAVQDYRREAARQGFGTFGDLLRAKLEGTK